MRGVSFASVVCPCCGAASLAAENAHTLFLAARPQRDAEHAGEQPARSGGGALLPTANAE